MAHSGLSKAVTKWNWRIHIYLGLYTLLFIWLFAVSGILMNHPGPHKPQRTKAERTVRLPTTQDRMEMAKQIKQELGLEGEILLNRLQPRPDTLFFRVLRPGKLENVSVNLKTSVVNLGTVRSDTSMLLELLHTFSGVRPIWQEVQQQRDWLPTRIWSFTMDAVAVGLVLQVLSSYYMWFQLRDKRLWGLVAVGLGIVSCLFFLRGLTWMR